MHHSEKGARQFDQIHHLVIAHVLIEFPNEVCAASLDAFHV
jgi:hypothetical protein